MKASRWFALLLPFFVGTFPNVALSVPFIYPEPVETIVQESGVYQGGDLDREIDTVTHANKYGHLDHWLRDQGFRRINGPLAGHNTTEHGQGKGDFIPYKNDSNQHGAIAVYVKGYDLYGTVQEFWGIWEFWRVGDQIQGQTWVLDDNGNQISLDTARTNRWDWYRNCVTLGCSASAATCAIANIIDAEAGFAPCYVAGCGGYIFGCGVCAIFCSNL